MKLINFGSGGVRPGDPWINMDTEGHDAHNFVRWNFLTHPFPFDDNSIDGIFSSHVFEHFDACQLQHIVRELYRILKPGGILRVSVPDASYFRKNYHRDTRENAVDVFGEPNQHPEFQTFMGWALFLYQGHFQVFTEDALWCTLVNREYPPKTESFDPEKVLRATYKETNWVRNEVGGLLAYLDNRPKFSLYMEAMK